MDKDTIVYGTKFGQSKPEFCFEECSRSWMGRKPKIYFGSKLKWGEVVDHLKKRNKAAFKQTGSVHSYK